MKLCLSASLAGCLVNRHCATNQNIRSHTSFIDMAWCSVLVTPCIVLVGHSVVPVDQTAHAWHDTKAPNTGDHWQHSEGGLFFPPSMAFGKDR